MGKKRLVRRSFAPEQQRQRANPLKAGGVENVDSKDVALLPCATLR